MGLAQQVTRKIREMREAMDLSRERLAELSGVPYRTIQNAEAPDGNPTVRTLEGVSRGLGCEPWELLRPSLKDLGMSGLEPEAANPAPQTEAVTWHEMRAFVDAYEAAPQVIRAIAMSVLTGDIEHLDRLVDSDVRDSVQAISKVR